MQRRTIEAIIIILSLIIGMGFFLQAGVIPSDPTSEDAEIESFEGEVELTVIPVRLADVPEITPLENISVLVFQNVSDYFHSQSYGKVKLVGNVVQWIEVQHNAQFYARGSLQSTDPVVRENASEGAKLFREDVFNQVTWTGSNYTHHVLIVYSGSKTIHPHHRSMTILVEGQSRYCEVSVVQELYSMATICHEIAHGFGLHDLYDKEKTHLGHYMGFLALMAQSGSGFFVTGMCGYSKLSLGWIESNEVVDVRTNSTYVLQNISSFSPGTKLLRISIDEWRYYLVESRTTRGLNSGVLITRVDCTRATGGYGRLEVVRSFHGLGPYDSNEALFRVGEHFIDAELGLKVLVISQNSEGYVVDVDFNRISIQETKELALAIGEIIDAYYTFNDQGTSYLALCALNNTNGRRTIHLYSLSPNLIHIANTSPIIDSFNPVLVTNDNEVLLIFEVNQDGQHSVIAQCENQKYLVSENDNACNPTASASFNGLYIAYENKSAEEKSIVVKTASSRNWVYGLTFSMIPQATVRANELGIPARPVLKAANNEAILLFLRHGNESATLEVKWNLESLDSDYLFTYPSISTFDVAVITEYQIAVSYTIGRPGSWQTKTHVLGIYIQPIFDLEFFDSALLNSFIMAGIWDAYVDDDILYFNQIWDADKKSGLHYSVPLNQTCLLSGVSSDNGTPRVFVLSALNDVIVLRYWYSNPLPLFIQPDQASSVATGIFVIVMGLVAAFGIWFEMKIREGISIADLDHSEASLERNG
ncbi:MAG: hypothetical protein ACFFER_13870 [Candidatus Thorarchaeota archaeon]